ncbi:MAG: AI-2E family transporter [Bryobacteraceae bacterium]
MLGIEPRAARAAWSVFLVGAALWLLYRLRHVLFVLFAAVLVAYLVAPLVNVLGRFTRRRLSRTLSLAAVYVLFLGLLLLLLVLLGVKVGEEASAMAARLPLWVQTLDARLQTWGPAWLAPTRAALLDNLRNTLANAGQMLVPLLQKATAGVASVVGGLIVIVLVAVLSFFLLKDGAELKARLLGAVEPSRRAVWEEVLADVHLLLGQFIRAWVLLALATFCACGVAFSLMGVPYSLLLATLAGALEFIPVLGPLAAAATIVLVVLISGHVSLWLVLGFLAAWRLFLDYVLMPHVMSSGLALHPVLVIAGALAGEAIAGVAGLFLAIPVMATLRVVYLRLLKRPRLPGAETR